MIKRWIYSSLLLVGILLYGLPAWGLAGIDDIPQSPIFHAASLPDEPLLSEEAQNEKYRALRERFFSPWDQREPRDAKDIILRVLKKYGSGDIYGENLLVRTKKWRDKMESACRVEATGQLGLKAVSLRETSLRLLPTVEPVFLSPDLPGEGYPFDYLQNSLVHGGEPLYLSHLSEDGLWAWCDTSYASGWIDTTDLASVDDGLAQRWRSMELAAIITEDALLGMNEGSLFKAKIGTLLPMVSRGATTITVEIPEKTKEGTAKPVPVRIPLDRVSPTPVRPSAWTVAAMAEQLIGEPYGWGGFLENRDCSATTRDLMLPLGIWLPRNSRAQASTGIKISLAGLSGKEKTGIISEKGVPFLSLIGQPGHIMLYIGTYRGKPLILHDMWGIRTIENGKEGRFVVGRTVISTLDVGEDLPKHAPGKLILDRIESLTVPGTEWR